MATSDACTCTDGMPVAFECPVHDTPPEPEHCPVCDLVADDYAGSAKVGYTLRCPGGHNWVDRKTRMRRLEERREELEVMFPTPDDSPLHAMSFDRQTAAFAHAAGTRSPKRMREQEEFTGEEMEEVQRVAAERDPDDEANTVEDPDFMVRDDD